MIRMLSIFAVFTLSACVEGKSPAPDFREALDAHIAAIVDKDLAAYRPTVTSGDDLQVIFPGGESIGTTEDVVAFHAGWFKDPTWRFEPEIIKVEQGEEMAFGLIKYAYRDEPGGAPRSSWLVLIFQLEEGEWRLVHDQNTRINPETEQ